MHLRLWSAVPLLLVSSLAAQEPAAKTQDQTIQEMMAKSIEKQKVALRKQLKLKAEPPEGSWFTLPWPNDLGPRRLGVQPGTASTPQGDGAASTEAQPTPAPAPAPVPAKTSALRPGCGSLTREQLDRYLEWASTNAGIPENLLRAVVHKESRWDPCAVSKKGAMGLMQLTPQTARWLGVTKPFDASQSLWGGAQYLRYLYDRYGTWKLALASYNAGPGNVDNYGGIPPFDETQRYVSDVMRTRNRRMAPPPAPIRPPAAPLTSVSTPAEPPGPPETPQETMGRMMTGMLEAVGSAAQRTMAPFTETPRPRIANAEPGAAPAPGSFEAPHLPLGEPMASGGGQ